MRFAEILRAIALLSFFHNDPFILFIKRITIKEPIMKKLQHLNTTSLISINFQNKSFLETSFF